METANFDLQESHIELKMYPAIIETNEWRPVSGVEFWIEDNSCLRKVLALFQIQIMNDFPSASALDKRLLWFNRFE